MGCIPHRRLLHRINTTVFESPLCAVCLPFKDFLGHFVLQCPSKEKFWQGVIFESLWPTTAILDLKEAHLSLTPVARTNAFHLWQDSN